MTTKVKLTIAGIAAIAVSLLLFGYFLQSISELNQHNAELNRRVAELTETSKSSTLDLQEKCSEHAKKAFVDWKTFHDQDGTILANSRSHYNVKLDKCFALFVASRHDNVELVDAYSGKSYGVYQTFGSGGSCYVAQPSGDLKRCEQVTIPDFLVLAKVYMEEDLI